MIAQLVNVSRDSDAFHILHEIRVQAFLEVSSSSFVFVHARLEVKTLPIERSFDPEAVQRGRVLQAGFLVVNLDVDLRRSWDAVEVEAIPWVEIDQEVGKLIIMSAVEQVFELRKISFLLSKCILRWIQQFAHSSLEES